MQDEMKKCPSCGAAVLWGDMIWLNGKCTCKDCYEAAVRRLRACKQS